MSVLIRSTHFTLRPARYNRAVIAHGAILWPSSSPRRADRLVAAGLGSLVERGIVLVGALTGLLVLWPVMLALALLIRLDSPGPVLFRQVRRGHRGRPFRMLKFRTMVADAEARLGELESCNESAGGVLFKLRDD